MPPAISVGLPVYNGARYLESAIDSILAQTFADFELIVSDNASTDDTPVILAGVARQDPRVRVVRNPHNIGASANFNLVARLATGRYFKWAAADDVLAPTCLERCMSTIEANPSAVLSYPKTVHIDERGETIAHFDDNLQLDMADPVVRFHLLIERLKWCHAMFGLMRPEALRAIGYMPPYPAGDEFMLAGLAMRGQFLLVPEHLFYRRFHAEASSAMATVDELQEFFDPRTRGQRFNYRWRRVGEHLRHAWSAPMTWTQRGAIGVEALKSFWWARTAATRSNPHRNRATARS